MPLVHRAFERARVVAAPRTRSLHVTEDANVPVKSASGVIALGRNDLLVVDDDNGVFRVTDGKARLVVGPKDDKALGDLEAITLDTETGTAYVAAEKSGDVLRFRVDGGARASLKKLGKLPHISKQVDHSWEGLTFLPASLAWDGKAHLIAGHQGQPRRFVVVGVPDLRVEREIKLDHPLKKLLGDIADLAINPKTGHVFALSDDTRTIVEMKLDGRGLTAIATMQVPVKRADHPEGIGFIDEKELVIVCDGSSRLVMARIDD